MKLVKIENSEVTMNEVKLMKILKVVKIVKLVKTGSIVKIVNIELKVKKRKK